MNNPGVVASDAKVRRNGKGGKNRSNVFPLDVGILHPDHPVMVWSKHPSCKGFVQKFRGTSFRYIQKSHAFLTCRKLLSLHVMADMHCKVCGNVEQQRFQQVYAFPTFEVWSCTVCNFHFVPPAFTELVSYDHYKTKAEQETVRQGNDWLKIQRHKSRLRKINRLQHGGKLFDLGVGWGHFLAAARDMGYNVSGVELSEYQWDYATRDLGLPVEHMNFFDLPASPGSTDVITMWDVLEHIEDAGAVLDRIHDMLCDNGLLVLQVPQIDSYISKKTRDKWSMLSHTHVNYFSPSTITRLLQDHGFEVLKIRSSIELKLLLMYVIYPRKRKKQGTADSISSDDRQHYFNKVTNRPKWILRIAVFLHDVIYDLLSLLNIGEEMVVYARKKA